MAKSNQNLVVAQSGSIAPSVSDVSGSKMFLDVEALKQALRDELRVETALEKSIADDLVDIECQRLMMRMVRERIQFNAAKAQLYETLSRRMILEAGASATDTASIGRDAESMVSRWSEGDPDAFAEIASRGISIDDALARSVLELVPQMEIFEKQCDRLADRSRRLMVDLERARGFMLSRKRIKLEDAELLP